MSRRSPRRLVAVLATLSLLLMASAVAVGGPAGATPDVGGGGPVGETGEQTALVFDRLGEGRGVAGFFPPADSGFDPVTDPYPTSNPSGWTFQAEDFAGTLIGEPPGGGAGVRLYCIDLFTTTSPGYGYDEGSWDASNVTNVGYVARALQLFYPSTTQPTGLTTAAEKAAAVQATIWFFSDDYVLATSDPLHSHVVSMVAQVKTAGPVPEPAPPSLSITPATDRGPAGQPIGPYTIATDDPTGAAVTLSGAPGGAGLATSGGTPVPNGTRVPNGTELVVTGVTAATSGMTIGVVAEADVPSGNVYLYDGNTPGVTEAQKLILAETAVTRATASASAEAFAVGSLEVTKTISGGDGDQGEIVIEVECGADELEPFVIPAGTADGDQTALYEDIEAGTSCTVTETADGANDQVSVEVTDGSQTVTVAGGEQTDAAPIVNAYAQVSPSTTSTSSTSTSTTTPGSTTTTGGANVDGDGANRGGGGALPSTGTDALRLGLIAAVVAAVGVVLTVSARRRRSA